jgi:hypothetical protein
MQMQKFRSLIARNGRKRARTRVPENAPFE